MVPKFATVIAATATVLEPELGPIEPAGTAATVVVVAAAIIAIVAVVATPDFVGLLEQARFAVVVIDA